MKRTIYTILLTTLLISCNNSPTSVSPEIGEPFKIKLGQSLEVQNEALNVRFEEMLEDSRCPEGATCFWAGNARIIVQLNDLKTELNTYLDPKTINLSDYKIEMISLEPYPKINKKIETEDYFAELVVEKI